MCGILTTFILGELNPNSMKASMKFAFNGMLFNEERGYDAAGIASIGEEIKLYKNNKTAFYLTQNKEYWDVFKNSFRSLICHSRASTNGKPEDNNNNHPFDVNGIIGCHNGTFLNTIYLLDKLKIKKIADVDSIVFFQVLNEMGSNGEKEASGDYSIIKEALGLFEGTAALVWAYKDYPDDLYVFCQGRPINWFYIYNYNLILALSDRYHLLKTIKQIEFNSKINDKKDKISFEQFPSWTCTDNGMFYHFNKSIIHDPIEMSLKKYEERNNNQFKMGFNT